MNAASGPACPSIMARVARVRKRMQIEVNTGIPASSKALFLPLCQDYEQRDETYFYTRTGYSGLSQTEPSLPSAALRQKDSQQPLSEGRTKSEILSDSTTYAQFDNWSDWGNSGR